MSHPGTSVLEPTVSPSGNDEPLRRTHRLAPLAVAVLGFFVVAPRGGKAAA
jgi:hypothetical protein